MKNKASRIFRIAVCPTVRNPREKAEKMDFKKKIFLLLAMVCSPAFLMKASEETEMSKRDGTPRVVLITLDGYRWQEVFGGADSLLVNNEGYVSNKAGVKAKYWRATREERRKAIAPFLWTVVEKEGLLIGDRYGNSKMEAANTMRFSYPGYNELLCGFADDEHIDSNDKIYNPNVSVLEAANKSRLYRGRVLVFAGWDNFPFILNERRSGLEVNSCRRRSMSENPTPTERFLDELQDDDPRYWSEVRNDFITFHYALEAMKSRHPKIVYIAFGETDEFAHDGRYDQYLNSARLCDNLVRRLWEYCQRDKFYKGKTTFIITCDHGRGRSEINMEDWKSHGQDIPGSGETWLAAFGERVPAKGVVSDGVTYHTNQVAPTMAKILGIPFPVNRRHSGKPIDLMDW